MFKLFEIQCLTQKSYPKTLLEEDENLSLVILLYLLICLVCYGMLYSMCVYIPSGN